MFYLIEYFNHQMHLDHQIFTLSKFWYNKKKSSPKIVASILVDRRSDIFLILIVFDEVIFSFMDIINTFFKEAYC